jgi:hypothetical protein
MNVDRIDVREHMRSLTVRELRQIAQNHSGVHEPGDVDAANAELTSRFSMHDEALFGSVRRTGDYAMPLGLRVIFYLVSAVAMWKCVSLLFFISVFAGANARIRMLMEAILHFGVPAAWAIWVAFTIRSEHEYVWGSLLSLLSLALVVNAARALLAQHVTYWSYLILGGLAVALCYVAFSGAVRRYYSAISVVNGG